MAFPRTITPRTVSGFRVPSAITSVGQSGKVQTRSAIMMGREWDETFPPLRVDDADTQALLAYIEDAYSQGSTFTIKHLTSPGSGLAPNGAGGGTPLIKGASETGSSIDTDGWSNNVTGVVKAGDVVKINGLTMLFRITADANSDGTGNATISISPPIVNAPADNAPITRADCTLTAYIAAAPNIPPVSPGQWLSGLTVTFRESL